MVVQPSWRQHWTWLLFLPASLCWPGSSPAPQLAGSGDEGWKKAASLFCGINLPVQLRSMAGLPWNLPRACTSAREVDAPPEAAKLRPRQHQMGAIPPQGLSCSPGCPCQGVHLYIPCPAPHHPSHPWCYLPAPSAYRAC